jgi:hypothetical protein
MADKRTPKARKRKTAKDLAPRDTGRVKGGTTRRLSDIVVVKDYDKSTP